MVVDFSASQVAVLQLVQAPCNIVGRGKGLGEGVMRRYQIFPLATVALFLASAAAVYAQELAREAPKTKLEAFNSKSGGVIIKGYTDTGSVSEAGATSVSAMTFRNANTGEETSGIVVEVKILSQSARSFIDYDEISDLLAGMEYVYKTEKSATKLRHYEATYSTKGDLKITVFNDTSGKKKATVQVGRYGAQQMFMSIDKLPQLAQLIIKAKGLLDQPEASSEVAPTVPQSDGGQSLPRSNPSIRR